MKRWTQTEKWALRNVKLRLSRKWLFVLALFACDGAEASEGTSTMDATLEILSNYTALTPTDIIARDLGKLGLNSEAIEMFDIYDAYLGKLDNPEMREWLRKPTPEAARIDKHFKGFKDWGRNFQDVLVKTFFEADERLARFTKEYGVF